MRKVLILLLFTFLLFNFYSNKKEIIVKSYGFMDNLNDYDDYDIKFEECILNTNNFISVFNYINDYKILKIVPYHDVNLEFIYYSNDLSMIVEDFKNKYINKKLEESSYVKNICISNVKIRASKNTLNKLKEKIPFNI